MMTARDTRRFIAVRGIPRTTKAMLLAAGAVTLGLAAGGCGKKQAAGGFAPPPTPVETAIVSTGAVADRFATVGTLEADQHVEVTTEIDGVVKALPFPEGGHVASGALLVRLDDVQLAAEAQRAEALRDQGKATFERVRSVVDQGAGAPQDLDDATAALKVAEANLDLARARLAKTRVTAPFCSAASVATVPYSAMPSQCCSTLLKRRPAARNRVAKAVGSGAGKVTVSGSFF